MIASDEPEPHGCARLVDSGAYLLDGLSADERADYARHLDAGCAVCEREVARLAGLPALLARTRVPPGVPGDEPASAATGDPVAGAVAAVRRARTRRRWVNAAAAVLVAGALAGSVVAGRATLNGPASGAGPVVAMQAIGDAPVSASVGLTDHPWGTTIAMTCHYEPGYPASGTEVLVARAADGRTEQLARWTPLPGRTTLVPAVTELRGPALSGLEVRTGTGTVLLRTAS